MRDPNAAGKVVGEIDKLEGQHKSVDKFLLDKAREYGFLADTGHTLLEQVYGCVAFTAIPMKRHHHEKR